MLAGLAVLAIAVWLLFVGKPVAAAFTRVGGLTRIETAVHASHLWTTPPYYFVTTPADAEPQTMLCAAQTAMAYDAPLLFTWRNEKNLPPMVSTTIDNWQSDAIRSNLGYYPTQIDVREGPSGGTQCLAYKGPAAKRLAAINRRNRLLSHYPAAEMYGGVVDRLIGGVPGLKVAEPLSTLPASDGLLPYSLPVARRNTLAPVVVFAVAKRFPVASGLAYPPDVAVGLALASHLAAHMPTASPKVSLVVVPRGYLEADPRLEQQLRGQQGMVQGGIVLGSTRILTDGTQALLRQILASTDRQTLLGRVQAALGSVEPVVTALLALTGLGIAAQAVRKVLPEVIQAASKNKGKVGKSIRKNWLPSPILTDIAELYTNAVEQLGSEKAPVRIGGLCALEQLAEDNPAHRHTILKVICGYLRLPFSPTAPTSGPTSEQDTGEATPSNKTATSAESGDAWHQEKQVRLTAQRLLEEHVRRSHLVTEPSADRANDRFWSGIRLNLTSATLFDFRLNRVVLAEALFGRAIFTGDSLLSEADLTRADLTRATLNDAKLNHAKLNHAKLNHADLTGAHLNDAHLNDAHLARAVFTGANLTGAHLNDADLTGANLTGAHLNDADLTGAHLARAVFTGADLTGARWPSRTPVPVGWRDTNSAGLQRAAGDSGDAAAE